jgi:hypothetical protein
MKRWDALAERFLEDYPAPRAIRPCIGLTQARIGGCNPRCESDLTVNPAGSVKQRI